MTSNRNIRKVFAITEYQSLLVFLILFVINGGVAIVFSTLEGDIIDGLVTALQTITTYWTIYGIIYLLVFGIVGVVSHVPYLLSLNAPRKRIVAQLLRSVITRALVIALGTIVLTYLAGLVDSGFAQLTIMGGFTVKHSLVDGLMYFVVILMSAGFLGSLGMLFGTLGIRFGWQAVVSLVALGLAFGLFMLTPITGLLITGYKFTEWLIFLMILNVLLPFVNYKLGIAIEVKA